MTALQLSQEIMLLSKEIKIDGVHDLTIAEGHELRRLLRKAAQKKDEHDPSTCDHCVRGFQDLCDRKKSEGRAA